MGKNVVTKRFASTNMLQLRGALMVSLLVLQFIIGMTLDLFIELPEAHPGTHGAYLSRSLDGFGWAITNGGGAALTLHTAIATLLVLGSIATLGFSIAARPGLGLSPRLSAW